MYYVFHILDIVYSDCLFNMFISCTLFILRFEGIFLKHMAYGHWGDHALCLAPASYCSADL